MHARIAAILIAAALAGSCATARSGGAERVASDFLQVVLRESPAGWSVLLPKGVGDALQQLVDAGL